MILVIFFDGFALIVLGLLALSYLYAAIEVKIETWKKRIAERRANRKAKKKDEKPETDS